MADEVRKLAEQSNSGASQVASLVTNITDVTASELKQQVDQFKL